MIRSNNTAAEPMQLYGASVQNSNYKNEPYPYLNAYYGGYKTYIPYAHRLTSITDISQVVGLVPVFPCEDTECRNGKYGSNDTEFMLPVFAENQVDVWGDYKNDFNSFLFNIPSNTALTDSNFFLDVKTNGAWAQAAELNDNTYGEYYPTGTLCDKNFYTGYAIQWNKVLYEIGEGVYRFRIGMNTGSFTESVNHFQITSLKPTASVELQSVGYGLICPTFTIDDALSVNDNMINLVAFINTYQTTVNPTPLFEAVWNAGTGQIDLFGLLGQNCPCTLTVLNVSYANYDDQFTGGENNLESLSCYASPPFCLKTWDCWKADLTTKFEAKYTGGVIGNINKALPGTTWSFCCTGRPVVYPEKKSMFWIRFWAQGQIYVDTTFTFSMDYGYDLVTPVVFVAGTTYIQCAQQLAAAINAYQATLSPAQFSAYYNPIFRHCEITNLFGQNIEITISFTDNDTPGATSGNTIQLTVKDLITFLPSSTPTPSFNQYVLGRFFGGSEVGTENEPNVPITWKDSIRIGGEFGYEDTEFERKSIKYQTGVVQKIRDELLITHTWKSSSLPFWFHERFKAYGLMADTLLVSDYNLNNSDYNIKRYSVQGESAYNPEYKGYKRETQVTCEFKPATQNLKRSRCC